MHSGRAGERPTEVVLAQPIGGAFGKVYILIMGFFFFFPSWKCICYGDRVKKNFALDSGPRGAGVVERRGGRNVKQRFGPGPVTLQSCPAVLPSGGGPVGQGGPGATWVTQTPPKMDLGSGKGLII